jgi:secondary thiamine-phosphate synthase enzyme
MMAAMTVYTDYLWFNTSKRREVVRITDEVASIVSKSGVREGMVLVSAMHITASVYVNDWESGLISDMQDWLEKLAPAGLPYKHHQTGEGQRRRALEAYAARASGDPAHHRRHTGSRARGSRCSTRSSTAAAASASS